MCADLPRVSEVLRILDDSYAAVPAHVLETAAERGTELHRLCLTYLAAQMHLCEYPVPTPPYETAYHGFISWTIEKQIVPLAVEQGSENLKDGYTGTPDTLVEYGATGILTLVDLKFTASILRVNRVQVQAYARLNGYTEAKNLLIVHIDPHEGAWKEINVKRDPHDWCGFLNAVSVYRWRLQ